MRKEHPNMSGKIVYLLQLFGAVIVSALIAVCLMFLVYLIPTERMVEHISAGIDTYANEGSYPWIAEGYKSFILDSETDYMMLISAIYPSEEVLKDLVMVPHLGYREKGSSLDNLLTYLNGGGESVVENYGRYWHGYLIFLKPFLYFFDIQDFRVFNQMIQFALILILTCLLAKRNKWSVIPLFILLVVLNPISCALSMQYSPCFYLTFFPSIAIFFGGG